MQNERYESPEIEVVSIIPQEELMDPTASPGIGRREDDDDLTGVGEL